MLISELLSEIDKLAKENDISTPYIIGGLPRDRIFGVEDDINDIDITTGDKGSFLLSSLVAKKWPKAKFKIFDDGHSSIIFKNINVDFSNNFNIPGISKYLRDNGIPNPTDLQKELYSRDFTINTLLQPMDLTKSPIDVTDMAINDIKNKVLRTPINPELTIGYDPRRILRALKLSIKFNLDITKELKDAIIKYRGGLTEVSLNTIKKQINKMLEIDSKKTIEMLSEYKLLPTLPLSKMMGTELVKNRMVHNLLYD